MSFDTLPHLVSPDNVFSGRKRIYNVLITVFPQKRKNPLSPRPHMQGNISSRVKDFLPPPFSLSKHEGNRIVWKGKKRKKKKKQGSAISPLYRHRSRHFTKKRGGKPREDPPCLFPYKRAEKNVVSLFFRGPPIFFPAGVASYCHVQIVHGKSYICASSNSLQPVAQNCY